jgi:molybdopterin molybdotransferase
MLTTVHEALARLAAVSPLNRTETLPLDLALGRVLAEPVRLDGDQPPFDRVTMDGFAVRLPGGPSFRIVADIAAGQTFAGTLAPGEAVRIMTGAPAPQGTTVVPLEATDGGPQGVVTVTGPVAPGRNIAWRGEDGRTGTILLTPGTRLAPATLALAALAGAHQVIVHQQPRLALITTGDEVGGTGSAAIRDSNGPYLTAFAASLGLALPKTHVTDDGVALRAALARALEVSDVVITTGGVGPGDKDLVPRLATTFGLMPIFHQVAMQPGKPVFVGHRSDGKFLVGLPGNPVSVLATSLVILDPLLRRLQGQEPRPTLRLPLTAPARSKGRHLFLPGRRTAEGITPIAWNGSGDLIAAATGDALMSLPPDADLAAGELVEVLPYLGTDLGEAGRMSR